MPEPLTTLPGDIPGLLRRGSPIVYSRFTASRAVVGETHGPQWKEDNGPWQPCETWLLDLTDATGRAHAAWWVDRHRAGSDLAGFQHDIDMVLFCAMRGDELTPEAIDTLARLCLRLAGRAS